MNRTSNIHLKGDRSGPADVAPPLPAGFAQASFSLALLQMKAGVSCRRAAWKPGKVVVLVGSKSPTLSYLAIVYDDGRQSPWTPTRCDLLEEDWLQVSASAGDHRP